MQCSGALVQLQRLHFTCTCFRPLRFKEDLYNSLRMWCLFLIIFVVSVVFRCLLSFPVGQRMSEHASRHDSKTHTHTHPGKTFAALAVALLKNP